MYRDKIFHTLKLAVLERNFSFSKSKCILLHILQLLYKACEIPEMM